MTNYYYYLHRQDYYRHLKRKKDVESKYAKNLEDIIRKISIGEGPPLLVKKYIWGRECEIYILSFRKFIKLFYGFIESKIFTR